MASTAQRRANRARIKKHRRTWGWGWSRRLTAVELGRMVDTPTPCSCWMCGNPRRHFSKKKDRLSIWEQRWFQEIGDDS